MGGKNGKSYFFDEINDETYRPKNFIRLSNDVSWICGGSIPLFKESFAYLKSENVGLIINTLIEPIKCGTNYDHLPCDFDQMSWTKSDDISDELKEFEIVNIPIVNNHVFYGDNSDLLLKTIRSYHIAYPDNSIYIATWSGNCRMYFVFIYLLMKFYDMTYEDSYNLLCEDKDSLFLSNAQESFLKGETLSDIDIYDSKPEIRTPYDHKCYTTNDDNIESSECYTIASPGIKSQHVKCRICLHQCDDVIGELFIEPIFRTLPEQIVKSTINFYDRESELEKVIPYFSQELSILFDMHRKFTITNDNYSFKDLTYKFVTMWISEYVPDMIAFIKRLGDYIVYFDRKGCGLLMDIGHKGGEAISLFNPSSSEGCPKNAFLYKDTSGDAIMITYRHGDYSIWRYQDYHEHHWIGCYNDYEFMRNFSSGFMFCLTTTGKLVLIAEERIYYVSFTFKYEPYKQYQLNPDPISQSEIVFYESNDGLVGPHSNTRHKVSDQLSIDSIPKPYLDEIAQKNRIYDSSMGQFYNNKGYSLNSIYAAHQYEDIVLIGHEGGRVSAWQAQ